MENNEELDTAQTNEATEVVADENAVVTPSGDDSDMQFTDAPDASDKGHNDEPAAKQNNSENARRRREKERQDELAAARTDAIIDALNGKNPYTGEDMKDIHDVNEYLAMKEIEKQGGDPVKDFAKHQTSKERERAQEQATQASQDAWYDTDKLDFESKYPDVKIDVLAQDKNFLAFADGKVGHKPLAEIYSAYTEMVNGFEAESRARAETILANKKATPGSLSTPGTSKGGFYTREQVDKMSAKEVRDNLDAIQESMRHW